MADVRAVVSVMGPVDRHGDIVVPGSFTTAVARVSEWNHSWLKGGKAVGWATLREDGDRMFADITYDDTADGRAACARVKREKPDWSIGYIPLETREPTPLEIARGARRVITRIKVDEVSPVDQGATTGSGTLIACCGECALDDIPSPKDNSYLQDADVRLHPLSTVSGAFVSVRNPPDLGRR